MKFPEEGFFWHVHHNELIEHCYSYTERKEFINTHKETYEQETRIRLFKPVKDTLPREVVEALKALDEAREARDEAGKAYVEEWKAYVEEGKALDEALKNNMPAIEALHREECLGCPWDGKTIFPKDD